jgi:hypothetical protein
MQKNKGGEKEIKPALERMNRACYINRSIRDLKFQKYQLNKEHKISLFESISSDFSLERTGLQQK